MDLKHRHSTKATKQKFASQSTRSKEIKSKFKKKIFFQIWEGNK